MAVLMIACILVFLMFGKNIVIGYNAFVSDADKAKTVGYFSAFLIMASIIWFILKYMYKPLAAIAFMIIGFTIMKKTRAVVDNLTKESKECR